MNSYENCIYTIFIVFIDKIQQFTHQYMYSKFPKFSFEGKACYIQLFLHTCTDCIVNKIFFFVTYNRGQ